MSEPQIGGEKNDQQIFPSASLLLFTYIYKVLGFPNKIKYQRFK